jgi:hypothetical protein
MAICNQEVAKGHRSGQFSIKYVAIALKIAHNMALKMKLSPKKVNGMRQTRSAILFITT